MTKEEYKMIQDLLDGFYRDHLSNPCYDLLHDIKSQLGLLYSTKLRYPNHAEISGYRYEELLQVAILLKEKHIKPAQLTTFMDYFQCGFDYCNKLSNEAFKKFFSKMFILKGKEGEADEKELGNN